MQSESHDRGCKWLPDPRSIDQNLVGLTMWCFRCQGLYVLTPKSVFIAPDWRLLNLDDPITHKDV